MKLYSKEKKGVNMSQAQKEILIRFLEAHPILTTGKYDEYFTYKDAGRMWIEVTAQLNSAPGAKKYWKAWRKTWQDMRGTLRKKTAEIERQILATGSKDQTTVVLSRSEERIKVLIESTISNGQSEISDSPTEYSLNNDEDINKPLLNNEEDIKPVLNNEEDVKPDISVYSVTEFSNTTDHLPPLTEEPPRPATPKVTPAPSKNTYRERSRIGLKRLHATMMDNSTEIEKQKIKLKKEYYNKKISLFEEKIKVLRRNAAAEERKADAIERAASALTTINSLKLL